MIVELIGLPGSGKTTFQTAILNKDEYRKYSFLTRDDIVKKSIIYNRKVTHKLMLLDPRMWLILRKIHLLKSELPQTEKRQLWINRFLVMYWAIIRNRKRNILLDEGVIQYVSSILHEERAAEYKSVYRLISSVTSQVQMGYIYLETDEHICLQRIRERNRPNDRFNKIEQDEELLCMLRAKKENIITIAEMADAKFRLCSGGEINKVGLERYIN